MTLDELARCKALRARLVAEAAWRRPAQLIRAGITVGLDAQALGSLIAHVEQLTADHAELVRFYETRGWIMGWEVRS